MIDNPYQPSALDAPPGTSGSGLESRMNTLDWLSLSVCFLPILSYAYVVLFWWMASIELGFWVMPRTPDPSDIWHGIPYNAHLILMLASFAAGPFAIVLGVWKKRLRTYLFCYLMCFVLSIILFRLDLWQITTWIAD